MTAKNTADDDGNRGMQILAGAAILSAISVLVVTLLLGWRQVPGWVGESLGSIAGVMSTPFFMEASFALLGVVIVIALNVWRRHKAGDEFVSIELEEPEDHVVSGAGDGR